MTKRIILTTATCDNYYLDIFKVFLFTMGVNGNAKEPIAADLINGNEEIYSRLKKIYNPLCINHIELSAKDWTVRENLLPLMRMRLPRMYNTMCENWDQILSIDCDSIVRSDIGGIWDGVVPDVIKIWDRGSKKQAFTRVQAGVHAFGNSEMIREYYRAFMEELGDKWEFRTGQATVYTVYLKFKEKIKLVQMPEKYNDSLFKRDSVIWHSKLSHFKETPFQDEFKKYLIEANKIYER